MTLIITVEVIGGRARRTIEVRRVTTKSDKRLTAHAATRILRREFPDFPKMQSASKSRIGSGGFSAFHSLKPTEKCSFHYYWKHYYLTEASD